MHDPDQAIREVKAVDGRILTVSVVGPEHGWPVFLLHGTPGSRTGPQPRATVLYRRGVRLISYDRPGYGGSTRRAERCIVDAAADVAVIADDLQLERFSVVGRSGGGPHALACAAVLSNRIHRVATMCSMAPNHAEIDWFSGMTEENVAEFSKASRPDASALNGRLLWRALRTAADPRSLLDHLVPQMVTADQMVVNDATIQMLLVDSYGEAVRSGPFGWIDDVLALRGDWGFEVEDVTVPVRIWHGADDNFSPVSHARWLASHIPGAMLDLQIEQAHFGAIEVLPDMLTWLSTMPAGALR